MRFKWRIRTTILTLPPHFGLSPLPTFSIHSEMAVDTSYDHLKRQVLSTDGGPYFLENRVRR